MEVLNIELLTELAAEMLTSPDKMRREEAAKQLRFMSCFEHWETVKKLLPHCQSNYLRFVVCKAIHFIVSNELGPQERKEMQIYALDYMTMMRDRGEELPLYLRNELYAIYASAVYTNWRLLVISMEEESKGIGKRIIDELSSRFSVNDVLDCLLEVLSYFSRRESKDPLEYLRIAFTRDILPLFFAYSAEHIRSYGRPALELCCSALESVPTTVSTSPITVRLTTDETVFIENSKEWFPAIPVLLQECGRAILEDPIMELRDYCVRLIRMMSTIVCVDPEWFQTRNAMSEALLGLSNDLLARYQSTGFTHLLELGCGILVNVFERDEGKVTTYLYNRPHIIDLWAQAARGVLDRWDDGEEELRQELMHLFFLFGNRVIPRMESSGASNLIGDIPIDNNNNNNNNSSIVRASSTINDILLVVQCYFDNVVSKAHLSEESNELRSDVGVMLHNEKTLLPIAEMLYCEKVDFSTFIVQRLLGTIEQYEACVRAREAGDSEGIGDLMLGLAIDIGSVCGVLGASDVPLFLMHVCLSRLSVIISVVAIAMLNETASLSNELIGIVARFATGLLSSDDTLTKAFLESLSLFDVDAVNGDIGVGLDENSNNNNNNNNFHIQTEEGKVHVGILRSLFFFCGCVYESRSEEYEDFYDIMINLLRYIYLYHSDNASLTTDANNILTRVLTHGVRGFFLASDKMTSILVAFKDESIELLRANSTELSLDLMKARSGLITALTFFVESRHYAGFPTLDVLPCLIARSFERDRIINDPIQMLRDLNAISDGIHQPDTLYCLLDAIIDQGNELEEISRSVPESVPLLLKLCSKLSNLATQLLRENNMCETRWGLVNFGILTITSVMKSYDPLNWDKENFIQTIDSNTLSENIVYNVADIIYNMINGHWCNLGVVLFYNEEIIYVFKGFISLILSTSVELLMSRSIHREQVFHTLIRIFLMKGDFGERIHIVFESQNIWKPLIRYLTKCLSYTFLLDVLMSIDAALVSAENSSTGMIPSVDDEVIGDLFHEVVVYIAVCPRTERKELELCFKTLSRCFRWYPTICHRRMDSLLDFCSAYHRVRLRHISTILHAGETDVLASYVAVFGKTSKVHTLSAW